MTLSEERPYTSSPLPSQNDRRRIHFLLQVAALFILTLTAGCAAVPYQYTGNLENQAIWRDQPQIEIGRPNLFIDTLGNVVSIPAKVILWNIRVDNHRISAGTVADLAEYLEQNDLRNVKIRVNQYAPGGEWNRLFRNRAVHFGWRYSLGALTNIFYTVLPGRVFGGDHYNPFTNTVNLYSDHPAIALHEAGHAKDLAQRRRKGTYAAIRMLPLVPLYQEAKATGDTVGYLRDRRETEKEKNAYKILYPAYGTYVGGEFLTWLPVGLEISYLIRFGFAVPGHIVGRIKAAAIEAPEEVAAFSIEPPLDLHPDILPTTGEERL
jgi:hypothetical protein